MSSTSPQVPKSATTIYGAILDDKRGPDTSTPAQGPTTLRPQSIDHFTGDGDENYPGIVVPPSTTPALHSLGARNALRREARNGNLIRRVRPLPELPSIARGYGAVQSREARHRVDPDFPLPTEAPTVAIEPCSMVCRDGDTESEEVPSISLFQSSSNFQISNTNINAIGGNATIIRFGDEFTEIQRNLICDYIANLAVLPDINNNFKKHVLTQSIISLPRAKAVFDDYRNKKKSGPCFKGTREALLREMADWATTSSESRMYILSGLAGIGKSTVAYTIASRAADVNLLGASFFFSRDEADRKNAEFLFTTIAYQLCIYNETFAKAIGDVLLTERGSAATAKDPRDQLQALILEPLRGILQSHSQPILIVVDALDECDEEEVFSVLTGLSQLVRDLPSFKIILTTRPHPYLDRFLVSRDGHKIFRLHDIEDKVVDGDIRLYLNHRLSLEKVQERLPTSQWFANDREVDALVRAAGRLFIIASTVVRIILDNVASNPAAQMQRLLGTFAQDRMPFKDLNEFYTVILRNVVPADCDVNIVNRYQSVVGAIIFVQHPLPITTLAQLIDIDVEEIRAVLVNLRSVILLGDDDIPRIYHKSFPDYITDLKLCQDIQIRIDPIMRHTQIVTHCFEIMDKHLERNILGLGDPARFMSNKDGLKVDGITEEQIQEKIPQQLRYACTNWDIHLEVANMEDEALSNGLERFADEHMLYWLEVLSLVGKLDSAHRAIGMVLELLTSTSSDLHQLFSDALRFVSKFYEIIKLSALHTYYSALRFTPTNSLLYHRYIKEAEHNIRSIEGGPEKWDALVANLRHGPYVDVIKFSLDSTLFVSVGHEMVKIWDAATGIPISTIPGDRFAVANDFSKFASSGDNIATLYNVDGSPSSTTFTASSKIYELALSSESSRVAAALFDGTIRLWDSGNAELIDCFNGFDFKRRQDNSDEFWLEFSPTGTRLAYSSAMSTGITLRDGISGTFIADLRRRSDCKFEFSGDGSRITSLSDDRGLTLWNSESGRLVADARNIGLVGPAISANGSLLATADFTQVTLWSENHGHLAKIKALKVNSICSMAFSPDNILLIQTYRAVVKLYNVNTHSFIYTVPFGGVAALSPDCTHLATTDYYYGANMCLWDVRGIDASSPPSTGNATAVTALALSRDCSRLACGFGDGTVELWDTSPTKRRIDPRSQMKKFFIRIFRQSRDSSRHTSSVRALGFDPDGRLLASGSNDGTVKLWNGGDGVLRGTLQTPRGLRAVALSNSVLVAANDGVITLWSLDTLSLIHTFQTFNTCKLVSIAENSTLIATVCFLTNDVTLFDVVNCTPIRTFGVPYDIHTMTFLPDNSQLVVQSNEGVFQSFDIVNNHTTEGPTLEHLVQLPNTPLWRPGVPVCHCKDKEQHYFAALFPQHKSPVPVLWIPKQHPVTASTQGSSIITLGYQDGRVILVRLPTSHVS